MPELQRIETTDKIIKAAIAVHKELGPHFFEVVYQRALNIELKSYFTEIEREIKLPIYYKGMQIDTRRADFIIEGILVETKAKSNFEPRDFEQLLCYLKASNIRIGLLLNFGAKRLEIKRMING